MHFLNAINEKPTFGRIANFHILCANMDAAESTDESADDITAAETAPSPEIYLRTSAGNFADLQTLQPNTIKTTFMFKIT